MFEPPAPNTRDEAAGAGGRFFAWLTALYTTFLVYGTLFPLSHWQAPSVAPVMQMLANGLTGVSRADALTNLLVYVPLGLFLRSAFFGVRCSFCATFLATALACGLSFGLEWTQAHLPGRVPAISDVILNTVGAAVGAVLATLVKPGGVLRDPLFDLRIRFFKEGALADLGLVVCGFWVLSQLSPLVPSIDFGNLRQGLSPLVNGLADPRTLEWLRTSEYALAIVGLGMLIRTLQRYDHHAQVRFAFFTGMVLLLKIPVVGRQLSMEALVGWLIALLVLALSTPKSLRTLCWTGVLALLGSVLAAGLYVPGDSQFLISSGNFNWVPFRAHFSNNIVGLLDILGGMWPFLALSYLAMMLRFRQAWFVILTGIGLFGLMFGLEWQQRWIDGRSADITDPIVALIGWLTPWLYLANVTYPADPPPASTVVIERRQGGVSRIRWLVAGVIAGIVGLAWGILQGWDLGIDLPRPSEDRAVLPAPEGLPPFALPGFRLGHPRLPAPDYADLRTLREYNPGYIEHQKRRAKQGSGNLESVIFSAFVEPGSQNLQSLHSRLLALEMSWRGHQQAKPLALAYDWLYDQWSPTQRDQLLEKLIAAGAYLIERIRVEQRLSPYNVYLYNSPFQALLAVAIASYADGSAAEPIMRWTADYWLNQVLPVWRQVMGQNGGWHEGGEYVGIGIGQAIYQVPAMWRKATGEDLFFSESGIKGFLDFEIYRTRPDGTHMRWGDGAHFDRMVPDFIPLAIEYRDSEAYSAFGCPRPHLPSSWPWGPLTRDDLCQAAGVSKRPLQMLFDGTGMLIARSDWDSDATFLTFKAGDNYWSHTHLDQGSFTLFKGAPLAIDSGIYGPKYGADHHMNYSYQTIAHNVVTVTDPLDDKPAPAKNNQPPRSIANDGGQRRVGSGWGIESAPLNLEEWQAKREIYHTGRIERYFESEDIVVAVADITPAYTNTHSGTGTFSHRTRRVEKYWRTLIYDRLNDLVIVHDRIVSTEPEFQKKSIVHTIDRPSRTPTGFLTETFSSDSATPSRAELEALVLYPRGAEIEIIGGPDREFVVDGVNYDEDGAVWAKASRKRRNGPEPGRWRVEVSPPMLQTEDRFLMVLIPTTGHRETYPLIERLPGNDSVGARITSVSRSYTLSFPEEREGVRIRIADGQQVEDIDLSVPTKAKLPPPSVSIFRRIANLIDGILQ